MNLITTNPTVQELAEALSPQEFELLVRAYVRSRMAKLLPKDATIILFCNAEYNKAELKSTIWQVGAYSETQTKGEILDSTVEEQLRRRSFETNNTLLLIEAQVEPETIDTKELDEALDIIESA